MGPPSLMNNSTQNVMNLWPYGAVLSTCFGLLFIISSKFFVKIYYLSRPDHKPSPTVFSMAMIKYSTIRLVISVEFSKSTYLLMTTRLHGYYSLLNVARMKKMIQTGDILDEVGKNQIIIVFSHTTVIMEVKPRTRVTL